MFERTTVKVAVMVFAVMGTCFVAGQAICRGIAGAFRQFVTTDPDGGFVD
jgi:hypothetical protein